MDWLLDNFGKLLPVVLMLLYFLLNKGKKVEDEEGGTGSEGSEEDDRVRRIQDEIRRRILERQQGESPHPTVTPPVLVEEELPLHGAQTGGFYEEQPRPVATVRPEWAQREDASRLVLEQQADLADRLAQARRMAVTRTADAKVWDIKSSNSSPTMGRAAKRKGGVINPLRRSMLKDLAAPDGLRRAILLREVLGEPVGMRRDSSFRR